MKGAWLLFLSALVATGCSWLVDPEDEAPRCVREGEQDDPCPEGTACVEGRCKPLGCLAFEICEDHLDNDCDGRIDETNAPETEECGNQADDDCDGKIDERPDPNLPEACNGLDDDCDKKVDEGHDQDGDERRWCGNPYLADGGGLSDCNDYDPMIGPGLPEICDGHDNDCDGRVDEAAHGPLCDPGLECVGRRCVEPGCSVAGSTEECPDGSSCDPSSRVCVPIGCTPESCPGRYCDLTSGECRDSRRANGDACAFDGDCASGSCVHRAALRMQGEASRVCGQACCSDADCPARERCFVSGSGARSCLPVEVAPNPEGARPPCLADDQCGSGRVCALTPGEPLARPASPERDDLVTPVCRSPEGGEELGGVCGADADCTSGVCVPGAGFLYTIGLCSNVCGTSDDCRAFELSRSAWTRTRSYCRFVSRGTDDVPVCVLNRGEAGSGHFGTPCGSGNECQDSTCVDAAGDKPGFCTIACCRDSDCPQLPSGPTRCRPLSFGERYEMRCVP